MPKLQENHILGLEPLINAYEGQTGKSLDDVLEGEGENDLFLSLITDGKDNGYPKQFHNSLLLSEEEISLYKIDKGGNFNLKCFLWVIDSESIKIIWEMTTNLKRKISFEHKPYVCHTNITGKHGKAYIGGEMYFCSNGSTYINFSSGRFGRVATEQKKKMAIQYILDCGFKNIIRVDYDL
jgi:hypothetical protein